MGETSLVRWLRAGPCAGEIQSMQSIGNSLGLGVKQVLCGSIRSNSVERRTSLTFSGSISRNRVELALCGTDFSIFVQIEHAMFWSDQGVSA